MTVVTSDNRYGTAQLIVAPTLAQGANYTTIASALTAASSGETIFIRPGTYTENLTLKAGVNLCAFTCDAFTPNVTISGTCTFTAAGTVTISGIRLQTNSATFLTVSGSAASIIQLVDCYLNCTNNTGISFTSSDSGSLIHLFDCRGGISTTGISLFTSTSAGQLTFINTEIGNLGASTTASTISAGQINAFRCNLRFPITTSSTGLINLLDTTMPLDTNTTCITTAGTGSQNVIQGGRLVSSTATAISVGSGTTLSIYDTVIESSNAAAIDGAGTLIHSGLAYKNTSSAITTTTIVDRAFGRTGTWTPGIAFGGGTTGITYTAQIGYYTIIGNVVFITGAIATSSKGSSTGNATLTGLPVPTGSNANFSIQAGGTGGFTLTATYTNIGLLWNANSTSLTFAQSSNSAGGGGLNITNAMFANAITISFSGFYLVA